MHGRLGNFTDFEPGWRSTLCWTSSQLANVPFWFKEHIGKCTKELRELCTNLCNHGNLSWFYYFLNVVLVRNLTLRMVRQVCNHSIHCRYFCWSNFGKTSQGRALVNSYIFQKIFEASWCHFSGLTERTEKQNLVFFRKRWVRIRKYPRISPENSGSVAHTGSQPYYQLEWRWLLAQLHWLVQ